MKLFILSLSLVLVLFFNLNSFNIIQYIKIYLEGILIIKIIKKEEEEEVNYFFFGFNFVERHFLLLFVACMKKKK
jgi:hypothetical protein